MDFATGSLLDLVTDEQMSLPPLLNDVNMPPLFSPLHSQSGPVGAEAVKEQINGTSDLTSALNGGNERCNLDKNREYAMSKIIRQIDIIKPLMANVNNEQMVRNNATELDKLFLNLQTVHEAYIKALSDQEDIETAQQWYNQQDLYVFEFKQKLVEYLERAKGEQLPKYKARSCKSTISTKTRSSVASSASIQSKLLATKAKAATLKVRAAFLKERQALRIAAEELDLKQQMAEVEVEEKVYEQELSDHGSVGAENPKSQQCPDIEWVPCTTNVNSPAIQSTPLSPNAPMFVIPPNDTVTQVLVPTSVTEPLNVDKTNKEKGPTKDIIDIPQSHSQITQDSYEQFLKIQQKQIELTETIANQQLKGSLPTHKPPVFSGDAMEFPAFITAFETLIESKDKDPTNLLYYLDQYTSGKAKELIKGCLQRKSPCSYQDARELLKKHYGDPYKIANAYIAKLSNWPSIKPNDGARLQEFAILLNQAKSAMVGMEHMNDLNTAHVLKCLWEKLPRYLRSKWCERANSIKSVKGPATFQDFAQFVARQADLANDPIYSEEASTLRKDNFYGHRREQRNKGTSFMTKSTTGNQGNTSKCALCQRPHDLDQCFEFKRKSLVERKDFVKAKGLCFGCYGSDHIAKFCKKRKVCQECKKYHPTTLHDVNWKSNTVKGKGAFNTQQSNTESTDRDGETEKANTACSVVCDITEAGDSPVSMGIIPVQLYHRSNPENKITTYALLDNASSGTFVKEESLNKLNVKGSATKLLLTTMHGTQEVDTKAIEGLVVEHFQRLDVNVHLPRTYVRQQIPADKSEIPRPEAVKRWTHLQNIANCLPAYMESVEIGVLIGLNCPSALRPRDVIHGKDDEPYAVKSLLGWYVNGPVKGEKRSTATCNSVHIAARPDNDAKGYVTMERKVKEVITPDQVKEMFEIEFNEREHGVGLSQEDQTFLKQAERGIRHMQDSHYEMSLPLKNENVQLPNNRPAAEQRLISLKKRLQHDTQYRSDYVQFMNGIIEKGYACKVDQDQLGTNDGRVWYIPHHGVYHPQKRNKIRVVFDCSARYLGLSLNDCLLQGPDLTNKLIGVLTRFRQERIAFMADIEQMFYQVKVKKGDQNLLRFLWWPNGELTEEPQEYCMTVHLFGATSSPGCSNYALKRTADDYETVFGSKAADTLRRNFYVDDVLKSVSTEEEAIDLANNVKRMCTKGGFNLTKFVSNSTKVIQSIPPENRAQDANELELGQGKLLIERALGVHWCVLSDNLKFRITLKDQPCTKRGILATISSVYDPLGLIAPVVLLGKQILQEICHGVSWDEPVPDEIHAKWERWRREVTLLEQVCVQRSFKPPNFGKVVTAQLHCMSDASNIGYGHCSYLRLVNEKGEIHCAFVMGKARVAPRKTVSIPRLELTAATLSVRVAEMLKSELDYEGVELFYWTDSEVVLSFINNESRRFHVYVANRVQLIRDHTSPQQWKHVGTSLNPADEASRGLTAKAFLEKSKWIKGPDFLWQKEEAWPKQRDEVKVLDETNPEVKKVTTHATTLPQDNMVRRIDRFSTWKKAKLSVAHCKRYTRKLKTKIEGGCKPTNRSNARYKDEIDPTQAVSVKELEEAEVQIVKWAQQEAFRTEIGVLQRLQSDTTLTDRKLAKTKKTNMKKASGIWRLDPFLDDNNVLRVGGRIKRAQIEENVKHPVLLPQRGQVTTLILRHIHEKVKHSGRGITLNELRSHGYWVVKANAAVRSIISKCVLCRHLRGAVGEQKMANLPESRLEPAPPFTYCAVDYFGPWLIKQGRKDVKRYGVLFTCMASRAIHLEVADSLETDSFILALRRFIARRGPVRQINSDQGTNFVGADNELRRACAEMDEDRITKMLLDNNIDWKRNPPVASHFGGVWERQIKSVRSILAALMKEHGHHLNNEALTTLLCETEAIVNGRPLTVESLSDPLSTPPLTPMMLLTGKSKVVLPPPGQFQRADLYCRRRWRQVQHLANEFWKRWRQEFLQGLQQRRKWIKERRNFQENDVVLVKDKDQPRNQWSLAKVINVQPDPQGLVRSVTVKMPNGLILDRPIDKLVLLLEAEA